MEEILTIFIGKTISVYTAKFYHGEYGKWERVTITEFPLSFIKSLFKRKVIDVPILLNVEGVEYVDFAEYNAIKGEMVEKKIRLVFADLHLHKNHAIMEKIPALHKAQDEIKNLRLQLQASEQAFINLAVAIEEINDDVAEKKVLTMAKAMEEIRKKVQTYPFWGNKDE